MIKCMSNQDNMCLLWVGGTFWSKRAWCLNRAGYQNLVSRLIHIEWFFQAWSQRFPSRYDGEQYCPQWTIFQQFSQKIAWKNPWNIAHSSSHVNMNAICSERNRKCLWYQPVRLKNVQHQFHVWDKNNIRSWLFAGRLGWSNSSHRIVHLSPVTAEDSQNFPLRGKQLILQLNYCLGNGLVTPVKSECKSDVC